MAGFSSKDEQFRAYALTAAPMKVLLRVGAPLAVYQVLNMLFRVMDSILASRISADAVSAVSCLTQITLMVTALGNGLSVGGSIKISEAYGRGDDAAVSALVSTVYALAVIISAAVALVLIPFSVPFLRLLQTPENLIATGNGYFRVEILSLVISFFNTVYIAVERSRGHAQKILYLNLGMAVLKLALSAFFVYVLEGGLILIAVATLAGQAFILGYALFSMSRDVGAFRFSFREIRIRREITLPVFKLAYPVAAEKVLFNAGKVTVNAMSGLYGSLTVGALGISNNIGGLTTSWQQGFTDGATPLISQNRGAGNYKRTLQLFYCLLGVNLAIGAVGLCFVSRGLPLLAEVFARSKNDFDPVFRDMIVSIHKWEMLGYITLGLNSAVLALLLGYGYTKVAMVLNVLRVFAFRVPVLWALQKFTDLGTEAVGITMMVSNVSTGIVAAVFAVPVIRRIHHLIREKEAPDAL